MDVQVLTRFFMWCTILNGALLLVWIFFSMLTPNLVYRMQSKWFPMRRETFTVVFYSFLGLSKSVFLVFNVVPFVALLIVGS